MSDIHDPARQPASDLPDWKESLGEFLQARLELFQLEARAASRQAVTRAAAGLVAVVALGLCWLLVLAGGIGWLSASYPDWPWWKSALAAGGVHLLVGLACMRKLRERPSEAFPLTRNELLKDRAWLDRIQNPQKSQR